LGLATPDVEKIFEDYYDELVASGEIERVPGLEDIQDILNRIIFLNNENLEIL